jgi:hypothetical protein
MENNLLIELVKKYPNNFDLGREVRMLSDNSSIIKEYCRRCPNDSKLGEQIRSIILNMTNK